MAQFSLFMMQSSWYNHQHIVAIFRLCKNYYVGENLRSSSHSNLGMSQKLLAWNPKSYLKFHELILREWWREIFIAGIPNMCWVCLICVDRQVGSNYSSSGCHLLQVSTDWDSCLLCGEIVFIYMDMDVDDGLGCHDFEHDSTMSHVKINSSINFYIENEHILYSF